MKNLIVFILVCVLFTSCDLFDEKENNFQRQPSNSIPNTNGSINGNGNVTMNNGGQPYQHGAVSPQYGNMTIHCGESYMYHSSNSRSSLARYINEQLISFGAKKKKGKLVIYLYNNSGKLKRYAVDTFTDKNLAALNERYGWSRSNTEVFIGLLPGFEDVNKSQFLRFKTLRPYGPSNVKGNGSVKNYSNFQHGHGSRGPIQNSQGPQ